MKARFIIVRETRYKYGKEESQKEPLDIELDSEVLLLTPGFQFYNYKYKLRCKYVCIYVFVDYLYMT